MTTAVNSTADSEPVSTKVIQASPHVQQLTIHSEALEKEMKFNIYLPDGYTTEHQYPVLYLLHGHKGTEGDWVPKYGADKKAEALLKEGKINPVIIVSPQLDNSYGLNTSNKAAYRPCPKCNDEGRYAQYFIQELIPFVDRHFSTIADREGRFIGGFSMGGWIALHHAFRHPELFSKAGGHSAALWLEDWFDTGNLKEWLYPTYRIQKQRDPLLLAETQNLSGLSVYLDCGEQDRYKLYQGTEALYRKLQSSSVKSELHLSPGEHNGQYLERNLDSYLLFYAGK